MMKSITTGPWEYEKTPHGGFHISQVGKNTFHTSTHYEADARAITVVPEMIDFLKYVARGPVIAIGLPHDKRMTLEEVKLQGRNRVLEDFAFKATALLQRIDGEEAV